MKIDHIREFIAGGFKVKVTLMFRGRELAHQETGVELVKNIIEKVSDIAVVDKAPSAEGRTIVTYLTSK
jgi:translation initiation factor IF-3